MGNASAKCMCFGTISAFITGLEINENTKRHEELGNLLRLYKYYTEEKIDEFNNKPEFTWVVPDISFEDLITLARKFEQSSVTYCSHGGTPRTLEVKGTSSIP